MEQVLYFTTAPSAAEKAKQLLAQSRLRVPGAVVVWDETAGRRTGAKAVHKGWWAGAGSLTVAFALPERQGISVQERLHRAAEAVLRVVASFQPRLPAAFGPPNDLLLEDRKLGALSLEPGGGVDLLTVRLNCCPDLTKAPPSIAGSAARLIDYIDARQLPLQKEGTLPNTFLTRLLVAVPEEWSAG